MNSTLHRLLISLFALAAAAHTQVGQASTSYVVSVTADRPDAIYK